MTGNREPSSGVRVIKQHHVVERSARGAMARLRRVLGTAGVYAIGYGNVGSSIYYALGIVAAYALGATPIALALAGIIFIFTAMTYAEGVSMVPTAGGSVAFACRAFNDLFSFVAGWVLTLDYIVTTAISSVAAAFYLSYFWPAFKEQPAIAAQMAEETKTPTRTVPRALFWSVITVIFMFAALPILALCAMPPGELVSEWGNDPVAGIASKLPDWHVSTSVLQADISLSSFMLPWVSILACTILLIAANAGILAGSRITYNMAHHRQIFRAFSYVHPRYQTPSFAICVISGVAVAIIAAGMSAKDLLLKLGDLYVFSSMMAFSMAHLSVWLLRIKEPDTPRPYSARPNIRIANRSISVTATLGFLACLAIWLWMALGSEHTFGRNIGLAWVCVGLIFYVWYRRREGLDLTRPAVKEALSTLITTPPAPRRQQMTREIRHILIPVHSREYAEELARIACDLSGLYVAKITAVYAIEVPRALPLDADLAERAREADGVLEVAAHIADTVYDRAIEIVTLQARSAGAAIVEYAAEKQVDLILLSANPERARTKDAIVFSTTADYVARNAPCMVWTIRGGSPNSARPQEPHPRPGSSDT